MATQYKPFIDWMKCVGILLIVVGHVAGSPINHLTPPIYPKQLGVAFFLFVVGYSLAQETRPRFQVVFNRLFEVYLFGLALALLISALFPIRHTLNPSNYLPFLFGANVVLDHFPANPTTWYVGTYLHILLLWALLPKFRVSSWMLAGSLVFEVVVRAVLCLTAGRFVAYMLFPNWMTVFLVGLWFGQRATGSTAGAEHRGGLPARIAMLAVFAAAWATFLPAFVGRWSFPFAATTLATPGLNALATSALVSTLYITYTLLFFRTVSGLQAPSWVRFFARNTLIIFLAHMPVFAFLEYVYRLYPVSAVIQAVVNLVVCLLVLGAMSEAITRLVQPRLLRDRVRPRLFTPVAPAQGQPL